MARRSHLDPAQFVLLFYPRALLAWKQNFDWRITSRWMFYSAIIGVLGALAALVFGALVTLLTRLILIEGAGYQVPFPKGEDGTDIFDLGQLLHPARRWLLLIAPAVGGLLSGWIVFTLAPEAEGHGTDRVIRAFHRERGFMRLRAALVKIVAAALTIGSGGAGGTFAPSLVIGGMMGSLYGEGLHRLFPTLITQPEAYVLIGMGTFVGGAGNVPIAATIMISEMTGSYSLRVPLIFAGVITHLVARRWSLFEEQVRTHNDSPAHRAELLPDLLRQIPVAAVVERVPYFHTVEPGHTLREMLDVFTRTREVVLPVMAPSGGHPPRYLGLVLLEDLQSLLREADALSPLIVAQDVQVPFEAMRLSDTLEDALNRFLETCYPELPVLNERSEIVGFLRPHQLISEYHRAMLRHMKQTPEVEARS